MNNLSKSSFLQSTIQYLDKNLAWSEMSSFTFIHKSLLMTKSPIVACRSSEVSRYNRCNSCQWLSNIVYDIHLLDRSRFPTLIAVNQKMKCDTKSVNHVVNRFIWLEMLYDLLFRKCNSVDKNIRRDLIYFDAGLNCNSPLHDN
jgi:hypothetical protein